MKLIEKKTFYKMFMMKTIFFTLSSIAFTFYSSCSINPSRFSALAEDIFATYQRQNCNTKWHVNLYNDYLKTVETINKSSVNSKETYYSSFLLEQNGMETKYLDCMAIEYAKQRKNTFISLFFPPSSQNPTQALKILSEYGTLVYTKSITVHDFGLYNLLNLIYEVHHCYGWLQTFEGIQSRFDHLIKNKKSQKVFIILWECDSLEKAIDCKRKVRKTYDNINNTVCHFTDRHREVLYVSQSLFNQNTIDFLNTAQPKKLKNFIQLIKNFQSSVNEKPHLLSDYCIDAGAVLAAYGIRDCSDLDIMINSDEMFKFPNLGSNNYTREKYGFNREDLIYDPSNFFYYKGLKFVALSSVYLYKQKKNNQKDIKDLQLIDNYFKSLGSVNQI